MASSSKKIAAGRIAKGSHKTSNASASSSKSKKPNWARVPSADGSEFLTLFYGQACPLSNMHPAPFEADGIRFSCNEQYFQYKKAECFGDQNAKAAILRTTNPKEQKQLGKQVANFDKQRWNAIALKVMKEGLTKKFQQNPDLKQFLLSTAGSRIGEASPRDLTWGIGLGVSGPKSRNPALWRGKNLLGIALAEVRDSLC